LGFDFDFSETNYENNCKSLNKIMEKCNEIEDLKAWFTPPCDINEPCLQYIFSKNKLLDLTEKIEFSWGTKKYMLCFYYNISNIKGGYVFSKYEI
jgi:hypothetical protein